MIGAPGHGISPSQYSAPGLGHRRLRVLVVEDSEDDTTLLMRELQRGGFQPVWQRVESPEALTAAVGEARWDVVICDHGMPHFSAPGALKLLRDKGLDVPFIIVSGTMGEELAVRAMKEGANDYVLKGSLARLVPAVARELRETLVRRDRRRAVEAQQQQAQMSAALARVGQELIAALGTPTLLGSLCRVTAEVLKCDLSYTLLWQPQDGLFVFVAGHGTTPEEGETARVLRLPVSALSTWLTTTARDDVVETPGFDLATLAGASPGQPGVGRQLCMPLRCSTGLIGLHIAACRTRSTPFTVGQRRIAQGIAQLASMTLQHQQVVTELERANQVKSDFVATMSHELRTPLHIIMGYNHLLLDHEFGPLTPAQSGTLQRMQRSAEQLQDLVNATLDLNRLDAGRLPINLQEIRVADLVSVLKNETHELQLESPLQYVWNVPSGLPALRSDLPKLKVILKNLIGNAAKFTEHGSVTIVARCRDDGVEFSVTDTGIGIAAKDLEAIFEPFRQLDGTTTRRYGGVGLGLYIVQRLLDALGGSIDVDSEVGQGSTFRVWLPLGAPEDPAIEKCSTERRGPVAGGRRDAGLPPTPLHRRRRLRRDAG